MRKTGKNLSPRNRKACHSVSTAQGKKTEHRDSAIRKIKHRDKDGTRQRTYTKNYRQISRNPYMTR
jgi:hypothetical protein